MALKYDGQPLRRFAAALALIALAALLALEPAMAQSPPDNPSGITATRSAGQIVVSWDDANGATGYHVVVSQDFKNSWTRLATNQSATTTTITGIDHTLIYVVGVQAVNQHGASGWVNSAEIHPTDVIPGPPRNLSATRTAGQIALSWDPPSNAGYAANIAYDVNASNNYMNSWTRHATEQGTTSATISVDNTLPWYVAVRAVTASAYSGWVTHGPIEANFLVLPAPASVTISGRTDTQMVVSWAAVANAQSYNLNLSTDGGYNWSRVASAAAGTSFIVSSGNWADFSPAAPYLASVQAVESGVGGAWANSAPSGAIFPPGPPASVTARRYGVGDIRVEWAAPVDSGGGAITGYDVNISADGGITWSRAFSANNGNEVATHVTGVNNATDYILSVRARNAAGGGAWLNSAVVTGLDAPASVTAYRGLDFIDVEWPHVAGARYDVNLSFKGSNWTRSFSDVPGGEGNTRTVRITGVPNQSWHVVAVRALNTFGYSAWTNSNNVEFAYAPLPVTNISATRSTSGEMDVTWNTCDVTTWSCSGGSPVTEYWVNISSNGGFSWTRAKTVAAGDFTSGDTIALEGVSDTASYLLSVSMRNRVGGEWVNANAGPAVTHGARPPINLTRLHSSGGGNNVTTTLYWEKPADTSDASAFSYEIECNGGTTTDWTFTPCPADVASTADRNVSSAVTYAPGNGFTQARIRASAGSLSSLWVKFVPTPHAPTNIGAQYHDGALKVWWDRAAGATGDAAYDVQCTTDTSSPYTWTNCHSQPASRAFGFFVSPTASGTVTNVRVRARQGYRASEWVSSAVPSATPPNAPGNVTVSDPVTQGTTVTYTIGWAKPSNTASRGVSYVVQCSDDGKTTWSQCATVASTTAATTTATATHTTSQTTYTHVRVRGDEGYLRGAWSGGTVVTVDYDADGDGLIEIASLAQLNAVRWDLDGNGTSTNAGYAAAFPYAKADMGCGSACSGYELAASLDFDTNGNGSADSGDTYWNGGAGWTPIGDGTTAYTGDFDGNNDTDTPGDGGPYTLENLYVNASSTSGTIYAGLFGVIGTGAQVKRVALSGSVTGSMGGNGLDVYAGILAGRNNGTTTESWSVGSVTANYNGTKDTEDAYAGGLVGGNFGDIRASYSRATITSIATGFNEALAGGLVGVNKQNATIAASYATGDVSASGTGSNNFATAGGLAANSEASSGEEAAGTVIASYSTGDVTADGRRTDAGGLIGSSFGIVTASYSLGSVNATGTADLKRGGLIGNKSGTVTASYWDTTTSGIADDADNTAPEGKTTTELQTPTTETGIYATWDVNVDDAAGNDDPWDFGTSSEYPTLKYGGHSPAKQRQSLSVSGVSGTGATLTLSDHANAWSYKRTAGPSDNTCHDVAAGTSSDDLTGLTASTTYAYTAYDASGCASANEIASVTFIAIADYDLDDDGLIEIRNLAQLNAVRWDLDGGGTSTNAGYAAAFPDPKPDMGCNEDESSPTCSGYELAANLDFDTDGDGSADSGDTYWNNGAGWSPIGDTTNAFATTFDGGGYKLSNLFVNATTTVDDATPDIGGLFGRVGSGGAVSNLGLENVDVTVSSTQEDVIFVGAVAADNRGTITGVWSTGSVTGRTDKTSAASWVSAGGLVGRNDKGGSGNSAFEGIIRASYSHAAVTGKGNVESVGTEARVGGVVGTNKGTIAASFATGDVLATNSLSGRFLRVGDAGGLVGDNRGTIVASYARGAVGSYGDYINSGGLVGENKSGATVTASYSTGAATGDAQRGADEEEIGGLVGLGGGTVTNSYWDRNTSGITTSAGGTAKTTTELQTPTGYTGIYANWNVNVDGVTGNDDPWDFGTGTQYPILEYGTLLSAEEQRTSLSASGVTDTAATLTIGGHAAAWYYEANAAPHDNCQGPVSTTTKDVTGLTPNTSYTYAAYGDSACGTLLATALAFTTPALTASGVSTSTATLGVSVHTGQWWYKANAAPHTTCQGPVASGTATKSLTGLTASTTYTYKLYTATGCADANAIASANFTTHGLGAIDIEGKKAKLKIVGYTAQWWYKADTAPHTTCQGPVSAGTATKEVADLSPATAYVYTAYSDGGCSTPVATAASFTTDFSLDAYDVTQSAARFLLHGWSGNWWAKLTSGPGLTGNCTLPSYDGYVYFTGLQHSSGYTATAYSASGCARRQTKSRSESSTRRRKMMAGSRRATRNRARANKRRRGGVARGADGRRSRDVGNHEGWAFSSFPRKREPTGVRGVGCRAGRFPRARE